MKVKRVAEVIVNNWSNTIGSVMSCIAVHDVIVVQVNSGEPQHSVATGVSPCSPELLNDCWFQEYLSRVSALGVLFIYQADSRDKLTQD